MVHRRTGRDIPGHVTDGRAVFDDVLPFPQILQQDFVPAGKVGFQDHVPDTLAGLQVGERDGDIVQRINLYVFHQKSKYRLALL